MKRLFYVLYTWIIFVPLFLVLTLLTALTTIVGCMCGGERIFSYYPGMIWSRLACYLALCPVKVRGREHIRKGQSYIFAANHQGAFDIFLVYGFLGAPIKWIMKASLERIPFVGAACRAAGFIFVDNSSAKAAARSVRQAEKSLRGGASVAIFPEGSRTKTGKMRRFKRGAFQMAADQHLPIIPITLNGPFHVLSSGSLNLHSHRLEMVIHEEISIEGLDTTPQGLQEVADRTRQIIANDLWPEFRD